MDNPSAREAIWVAARNNDKNALFDLAFALDWGRDGGVPSATFTLVLDALADDEFIGSGAAHALLENYEQQALGLYYVPPRVPSAQREALFAAMERAYLRSAAQLRFEIGVILGEHFADDASVDVLTRLRSVQDADGRDTVAHALAHLATGTRDDAVRERALAVLRTMVAEADVNSTKAMRLYLRGGEQRRVV